MGKKQAEEIARNYVQSHKGSFGKVTKKEVENAVQRIAGALQGLSVAKQCRKSHLSIDGSALLIRPTFNRNSLLQVIQNLCIGVIMKVRRLNRRTYNYFIAVDPTGYIVRCERNRSGYWCAKPDAFMALCGATTMRKVKKLASEAIQIHLEAAVEDGLEPPKPEREPTMTNESMVHGQQWTDKLDSCGGL